MRVGAFLGPYRLLEELGSGATGTVFLAEQPATAGTPSRIVALKVFHAHLSSFAGFVARFEREAEAGQRVVHENVVRVLDAEMMFVEGEVRFFLVMEPVSGRTLRRALGELGPLPEPLLREIALEAARGLAAVHGAGLVHRDVKPDNVILTDDGRVRLMDLGVARVVDASRALTGTGSFVGTLLYAAPEVLGGASATAAADVYGLGVTLYELAAGRNPFLRDSTAAVLQAQMGFVPAHLRSARPELSPFLDTVVGTMLAKRVEDRFPTATALLEVLEAGERSAWWAERVARVEVEDRRRAGRPFLARPTTLHGRETDLAALAHAWERARGGAGGAVWLEGEAGIGKSRLVDEFLDREAGDARVLFASYAPGGDENGLATSLRSALPPAGPSLSARLGDLFGFGPALEAEAEGRAPPAGAPRLPPEARAAVFARLLDSFAAEGPVVWVVEDAHFAPASARALVRRLAREAAGRRALIVVTAREGLSDDVAAWASVPGASHRTVSRLSPREVILLLGEIVGSPSLAERLGGRIAFASDGVPFHVFEIVRGLKEGKFLSVTPEGGWLQTKDVDRVEVPASLRDVLRARLADLAPDERILLDVAAVLDFEFDPEIVAAALDRRVVTVLQALAQIERRTGLVRGLARSTRFDHHLVQEMLRLDLPPRLAAEYHALVGAALDARADAPDADLVARCRHHLLGSHPEVARPLLGPALGTLQASDRFDALVALTTAALDVPRLVEGRDRLELLNAAGAAALMIGRRADLDRFTADAVALATALGDPGPEADTLVNRSRALGSMGRNADALPLLERAVDRLRASGASGDQVASVESFVAMALHGLGRVEEAFARARAVHERLPATEGAAHLNVALTLSRIFAVSGRWSDAVKTLEAVGEEARRLGQASGRAALEIQLAGALSAMGRLDDAAAAAERALGWTRSHSMVRLEANALSRRAEVAAERGDLRAALDDLRLATSVAETTENEGSAITTRLLSARIAVLAGDPATGLAGVAVAIPVSQDLALWRARLHARIHVVSIGLAPAAALAEIEALAADPLTGTSASVAPRLRLLRAELGALAGATGPALVAEARQAEREARAQPCPALVWRAVAVRALLGDADATEVDAARAACAEFAGLPDRVRNHYLAWRATDSAAERGASLAALARMRAGLPPPVDELPFVRELRA